ncbi:MAG: hypothetical protein AAB574_03725 [Patescibacteria group bacterium]
MIPPYHHSHKSRNIFLLCLGLFFAYLLYRSPLFPNLVAYLIRFGYLGGLLGGFLFSSTLTAIIGLLLILSLAPHLSLFGLVSAAALGAVIGDIVIFYLIRNKIDHDSSFAPQLFIRYHLTKLFHSRYFSWTLPIVGALIIMSPLPDELGISLFSVAHTPVEEFAFVSLMSRTFILFLLISAASLIT